MGLRYIAILLLTLVITGCQSSPDTANGGAGGAGGIGGSGVSGRDANIIPGTQEDLVATVGDRVFFELDSSVLSEDAQQVLAQQARWLNQYSNVNISVEGHCDERGTREYNLALGERRAAAARNYLVNSGVASSRISTISYGKERPEALGSNDRAWSQNRRAVVIVN